MKKILTVVGARPQFIKCSMLRKEFYKHNIKEILVHTGQHYDFSMSKIFFQELKIKKPDYLFAPKQRDHSGITGEIMTFVSKVILKEKPDLCLVYGDTNSTLAGALAAAKNQIPVCHIEAGLRSFNNSMPEEINRKLTDHLSTYLFCPTKESVRNLYKENIKKNVFLVGDIMLDVAKIFNKKINNLKAKNLLKDISSQYAVLTIHRHENILIKKKLKQIFRYCKNISQNFFILFPAHPRTLKQLKNFSIDLGNIKVIKPLSYISMSYLIKNASLVLTDSGGLQKEAYFNKTRCITLRDETEWIETINNGWNKLWSQKKYKCEPKKISDYGNGETANKIINIIKST